VITVKVDPKIDVLINIISDLQILLDKVPEYYKDEQLINEIEDNIRKLTNWINDCQR